MFAAVLRKPILREGGCCDWLLSRFHVTLVLQKSELQTQLTVFSWRVRTWQVGSRQLVWKTSQPVTTENATVALLVVPVSISGELAGPLTQLLWHDLPIGNPVEAHAAAGAGTVLYRSTDVACPFHVGIAGTCQELTSPPFELGWSRQSGSELS